MQPEHLQVAFIAPVPRGHQVLYAWLRMAPDSDTFAAFIHDRTAGVVYCDRRLAGPLGSVAAIEDPLGVLSRFSWCLEKQLSGRVVGALCSASDEVTRTLLVIAPEPTTYR